MAQIYIGLSGFDYKEWQGDGLFYPPTIKKAGYLEYYSSRLNSLELNGTHMQLPSDASVERWNLATPAEFVFAPKMHREVTHFKRLKPEGHGMAKLFVERLEPFEKAGKLGPILVQLPPNLKRDDALLLSFLGAIPHRPTLKWAFEFRNDSWNTAEVEQILLDHGAAWVAAETDEEDAQLRDTADFLFARLRRLEYSDEQLKEWAKFFKGKVAEGKNYYIYCRHKDTVAPWKWADRLRELTG
jgi:uncharacterized protein YecE (DUF72 family)